MPRKVLFSFICALALALGFAPFKFFFLAYFALIPFFLTSWKCESKKAAFGWGFLTGLLAFIITPVAIPVAFLCSLLLSYMLGVIHFFSHLPLASVTLKTFPLVLVILIYAAYLWFIVKNKSLISKNNETY